MVFSFEALRDRRLRSALTIIMVSIGVALIIALNGLSSGVNIFIENQFSTLAPNVLTITPASSLAGVGSFGGGFGSSSGSPLVALTPSVARKLESIPGTQDIVPSYRASVQISTGKVQSTTMIGIDTDKLHLIIPTLDLESGRLIDPTDAIGVGLGNKVAHPPGEDIAFAEVGRLIKVERQRFDDTKQKTVKDTKSFIVRGILKETGNPLYDNAIFISLSVADSFLKKSSKFDNIFVVTDDADLNPLVEQGIRGIYGRNVGISSPRAILQTVNTMIAGFTVFLSAIGGVSILVGGVGIVTTLFTAVMERTKEIGTLKALGATSQNILLLFVTEAFIIGVLGGSTGLLMGAALSYGLIPLVGNLGGGAGVSFSIVPAFAPETLLIIYIIGVAVSTVAGFYPAWRASKLKPVEALRKE